MSKWRFYPLLEYPHMFYLLEDFMEQSLVMKAFVGLGWLAVAIMGSSLIFTILTATGVLG